MVVRLDKNGNPEVDLEKRVETHQDINTQENQDSSPKTEYRLLPYQSHVGDLYLQFKSSKNGEEVWRFVPTEITHIFDYINEENCPTQIDYKNDGNLMHCFMGQEDYQIGGVIPFTKEFPDINDYFKHFNTLRDKHLDKKSKIDYDALEQKAQERTEAIKNAPITYL